MIMMFKIAECHTLKNLVINIIYFTSYDLASIRLVIYMQSVKCLNTNWSQTLRTNFADIGA